MTTHERHDTHEETNSAVMFGTVRLLERLDNWAHVIVAAFFILMASTVIIHMGFIFLRQLPLIAPASTSVEARTQMETVVAPHSAEAVKSNSGSETIAEHPGETGMEHPAASGTAQASAHGETMPPKAGGETMPVKAGGEFIRVPGEHAVETADPFVKNSLELLSNILFVVILLELLRTIITYLQTHDIQAIMQEFLVVGIISSVRKILLVGAEASLSSNKSVMEFIQESTGVVIDILGILLLILGLVLLKRAFGNKVKKELEDV